MDMNTLPLDSELPETGDMTPSEPEPQLSHLVAGPDVEREWVLKLEASQPAPLDTDDRPMTPGFDLDASDDGEAPPQNPEMEIVMSPTGELVLAQKTSSKSPIVKVEKSAGELEQPQPSENPWWWANKSLGAGIDSFLLCMQRQPDEHLSLAPRSELELVWAKLTEPEKANFGDPVVLTRVRHIITQQLARPQEPACEVVPRAPESRAPESPPLDVPEIPAEIPAPPTSSPIQRPAPSPIRQDNRLDDDGEVLILKKRTHPSPSPPHRKSKHSSKKDKKHKSKKDKKHQSSKKDKTKHHKKRRHHSKKVSDPDLVPADQEEAAVAAPITIQIVSDADVRLLKHFADSFAAYFDRDAEHRQKASRPATPTQKHAAKRVKLTEPEVECRLDLQIIR